MIIIVCFVGWRRPSCLQYSPPPNNRLAPNGTIRLRDLLLGLLLVHGHQLPAARRAAPRGEGGERWSFHHRSSLFPLCSRINPLLFVFNMLLRSCVVQLLQHRHGYTTTANQIWPRQSAGPAAVRGCYPVLWTRLQSLSPSGLMLHSGSSRIQ